MKIRFLGTGTSVGVPMIGCRCPVCTSADSRDRRRRCGLHVREGDTAFLIDTPPELREACLAYGIDRVDAVVLTHAHMDHVAGFDDVRRFNSLNGERVACDPDSPGANGRTFRIIGRPLTCYALDETAVQMHAIFPYIGVKGGEHGLFRPQISFDTAAEFRIGGVRLRRLAVEHGFPCCGYLLESPGGARVGYVSDCHELPEDTIARLRGVDVMILNCLRERQHPTHLTRAAAEAYLKRIAPGRAYLTHLCHDLTHVEWLQRLPPGVEPAFDGLELSVGEGDPAVPAEQKENQT